MCSWNNEGGGMERRSKGEGRKGKVGKEGGR